jgi:hypothetical protein
MNYRLDRGFIAGAAFNFGSGGLGQNPTGHVSSFGLGMKIMNRQGLNSSFNLYGTELLDILANTDGYKAIRRELGYSKGSGHGFDAGFEHNYYSGSTRMTFGLSYLDAFDTKFKKEDGIEDVPMQEQSLNAGFSFNQDLGLMDYTLAADLHNIIDGSASNSSKIHLGARLRLPLINIYSGWNGGYMSWGLGLKLFFFEFSAGFYGIEAGKQYQQKESERMVFMLNLADINIAAF